MKYNSITMFNKETNNRLSYCFTKINKEKQETNKQIIIK